MDSWDEEMDFWMDYYLIEHSAKKKKSNKNKKNNEGCYIATCVYGSYDCPQVWALRRFRDFKLKETPCGRAFVRFYYAVSPSVVRVFGKGRVFVSLWRKVLDKLVLHLKGKGFSDAPYDDKK